MCFRDISEIQVQTYDFLCRVFFVISPGVALSVFWVLFGRLLNHLGHTLGDLGGTLGAWEVTLGNFGTYWGHFGSLGGHFGLFWDAFGARRTTFM